MNLVIDIGNTRIKTALYKGNELVEFKTFSSFELLLLDINFIKKANNAIIGSVVDGVETYLRQLDVILPTILFTTKTQIPILNKYQSVVTLGSDRLSASIAAYYLHPNANVLTIDVGTCIKYNFTNSNNEYLGGGISPGLQMRFKALQHFTSKLPLVITDENFNELIGTNTHNSILSGVLNGCIAEVDGIINEYNNQFPKIYVLLTGGDADFFAKRLKNSIFAHPNLVLKGLNHILNYTIEKR